MTRYVTLADTGGSASNMTPLPANPRPYFPRSFVATDCVAGLERIFDDPVSVCIWRRPVDAAIDAFLAQAAPAFGVQRAARVSAVSPCFDGLLADLNAASELSCIVFELGGLVDLFSTLTGADSIGVRISSGNTRSCPRFHVDRVGLRMVCTWRGPGTEWLEHGAVNRRFLGGSLDRPPDERSGLLRPGAQIYQMRPFDIGLFKGELWPNNRDRGAVHRSPAMLPLAPPRATVTLDKL